MRRTRRGDPMMFEQCRSVASGLLGGWSAAALGGSFGGETWREADLRAEVREAARLALRDDLRAIEAALLRRRDLQSQELASAIDVRMVNVEPVVWRSAKKMSS
jgi:hypothetical protein